MAWLLLRLAVESICYARSLASCWHGCSNFCPSVVTQLVMLTDLTVLSAFSFWCFKDFHLFQLLKCFVSFVLWIYQISTIWTNISIFLGIIRYQNLKSLQVLNFWLLIRYQPSGARATRLEPATPHHLQHHTACKNTLLNGQEIRFRKEKSCNFVFTKICAIRSSSGF